MRLLLDTTYLLPAIGISIKDLPKDTLVRLMQKGHQISISNISIFELSAKGAKHVAAGTLSTERVTRGIRAIVYDERITVIPMHDSSVLLMAFKLRRLLSDFIDCLILSSAVNRCDAILTEDNEVQDLKRNKEFAGLVTTVNPKFKIQTLTDTL
ncbi:MAG: PIN domain-containing protein [Candidatus Bathyarchaeia archaeon]|nr:PIN domain-containing protein [Candidatus Bathyarchaeia archaeon]